MRRDRLQLVGLWAMLVLALACPASAQESAIRWQQDIEAAKALAKQSGRLVLVHIWADGCVPCQALETNVFSQPAVAGAVESRFVPVKLNANENPATAQYFGISRVPTDLILTPDGELLAKMISPATPAAYVGELSQVANQYAGRSGQAYQMAAAAAPQPAVLNQAYANLHTTPPVGPPASARTVATTTATATTGAQFGALPTAASQPPLSVPNGYAAATPPTGPASASPASTARSPFPTASQYGYDAHTPAVPTANVPRDVSIPPANTGGISTSSEARHAAPASQPTTIAANQPASQPLTVNSGGTAAPDTRMLPAGVPPLGFEGYCPVTMRHAWKWTAGDPRYGIVHRGRTYWFAGPQEQQQFWANPDFYAPALSGIDPVLAIDHGQTVQGTREHSLDYDNQFYMFSSEATLEQFTANREQYATQVRQAMGMSSGRQMR